MNGSYGTFGLGYKCIEKKQLVYKFIETNSHGLLFVVSWNENSLDSVLSLVIPMATERLIETMICHWATVLLIFVEQLVAVAIADC